MFFIDPKFFRGYIFLFGFNAYILIALSGIDIRCLNVMILKQKALHYVVNTGYQGVLQSDLWRELGAKAAAKAHVSQLNWKKKV